MAGAKARAMPVESGPRKHHEAVVGQSLHGHSAVQRNVDTLTLSDSKLILVPRAEHRVLDEHARTRRPDRERGVRGRGAALERDA